MVNILTTIGVTNVYVVMATEMPVPDIYVFGQRGGEKSCEKCDETCDVHFICVGADNNIDVGLAMGFRLILLIVL